MDTTLDNQKQQIIKLLKEKSVMKQDVFKNTVSVFSMMKEVGEEVCKQLKQEIEKTDKRVTISFTDRNQQSMDMKIAGDMLSFYMHTNVFDFDKSHPMFKTGYVKQHEFNSYCGVINVYNFLADSVKYNRLNDLGYLIARVFVNRESRFFIEAKSPLGLKHNIFSTEPVTKEKLKEIINDFIIFIISFDLYTPPFDSVREVSVNEIQEKTSSVILRTGKRLGYGTSASYDDELNL